MNAYAIISSERKASKNREIAKILGLCVDNDVYLICYEKDYTRCHRSIVAKMIFSKIGIPWEEAKYDKESKNRENTK